jgi:hypothetical protein
MAVFVRKVIVAMAGEQSPCTCPGIEAEIMALHEELDRTKAWCASLEEQLAQLRAVLRLLGAWSR